MRQALLAVLRASVPYEPGFVLAHGDARGGDLLWEEAARWVCDRHSSLWMPIHPYPARWREEGKAAGPLRSRRMLVATRPSYWLAAHWNQEPDTSGTADMVQRLRDANVPGHVVIVPRPAKEET